MPVGKVLTSSLNIYKKTDIGSVVNSYSVKPGNLENLSRIALPSEWLKLGIKLKNLSTTQRAKLLTAEQRLGKINLVLVDRKGHPFISMEDNGKIKYLIGFGSTVFGALIDLMEQAQKYNNLYAYSKNNLVDGCIVPKNWSFWL